MLWRSAMLLVLSCVFVHAEEAPPLERQTRQVEGWTLHIRKDLIAQDAAAVEKAVVLLAAQLQEIQKVVPAQAVAKLKEVPLWFSPEYPKIRPPRRVPPRRGVAEVERARSGDGEGCRVHQYPPF